MKKSLLKLVFLACAVTSLQGCISFPPLIQVEHKDSRSTNDEILRRLDAIDRRLDHLEQKSEKK